MQRVVLYRKIDGLWYLKTGTAADASATDADFKSGSARLYSVVQLHGMLEATISLASASLSVCSTGGAIFYAASQGTKVPAIVPRAHRNLDAIRARDGESLAGTVDAVAKLLGQFTSYPYGSRPGQPGDDVQASSLDLRLIS